jgi:hypothetical protein
MKILQQPVLRYLASWSDPFGFDRGESFWNSLCHGFQPWCLGQFQLSSSVEPRWVPRSFSDGRSRLAAAQVQEKSVDCLSKRWEKKV